MVNSATVITDVDVDVTTHITCAQKELSSFRFVFV